MNKFLKEVQLTEDEVDFILSLPESPIVKKLREKLRKEKYKMTYSDSCDWFMRSFPGGKADKWSYYFGGNTFELTDLRLYKDDKVGIPLAIVTFDAYGETWVFDVAKGKNLRIKPFTQQQYNEWKEQQHDNR